MSRPLHLLILEDNLYDLQLELALLEKAGYTCQWKCVETQAEFLECLNIPQTYDLILADYSLPTFDGLTALNLFLERELDLPFIFVSGTVGEEIAIESIRAGATDYVLKNRLSRLGPVVQRALQEKEERQRRKVAEARYQDLYRQLLQEQANLQQAHIELAQAYNETLEGWARALELRDNETEGHSRRVVELALHLARAMGIDKAELEHIRRGALLHDIGKMAIPDSILLKSSSLNDEEWEIMRKHPVYAYQMLSPIAYLHPALDIPRYHHERWDGTGYPHNLKGEQIPLVSKLL